MIEKLQIMDWLVHGGHQYEFFKTGPQFFCTKTNGKPPSDEDFGRPALNGGAANIVAAKEKNLSLRRYDIIMARVYPPPAALSKFYEGRKRRNTPGIAVVQTSSPFKIPRWARVVVWNSKHAMDENYKNMPDKKHFYIPHGFDPDEFRNMKLERNDRILTVANVFEKRGPILGFNEWRHVSEKTGLCDLVGHGDDGLSESLGNFGLRELVSKYNEYGVYLSPTISSAMPRSRAEALMCGTPLVTTNNYGISRHLKGGRDCLFANTREEMITACKKILGSKDLQAELSAAGRLRAIEVFGIKEYKECWSEAFEAALK
jgi:glycosyltransferase involved in cell wall biosynthesis